jgi:hypothetical protein
MRKLTVTMLAAIVAVLGLASPARAATNPFTAAQACNNDFGGSWAYASDGHRTIYAGSTKVGDVYLMYNGANGHNCVVTLKTTSVGSNSGVAALLQVEGSSWAVQSDNYKYYAAVDRSAVDKCVKYSGEIMYGTSWYTNGRNSWGNCG